MKILRNDEKVADADAKYICGKNMWLHVSEVCPSSQTRKHYIFIKVPVLRAKARDLREKVDSFFAQHFLFTNDILQHIVKWGSHKIIEMKMRYDRYTNLQNEKQRFDRNKSPFFGLPIFISVFNSYHKNIGTLFAVDGTERAILGP